jgi:alcohol dehydrogenase (NADP+)
MRTWRKMEKLVDMGLVKHIGTSNMTKPKLELLLRDARIRPSCNQMELHPHFQQKKLFNYCRERRIVPVGFSPIGSPTRPDRDVSEGDTIDIEDPVILKIAEDHGVHPAVVCVKWAVQRGQIPIPFSIYREEYLGNLTGAITDPLTKEEMKEIKKIDKGCRLIKGQVFLWPGAEGWEDLWDLGGVIPS